MIPFVKRTLRMAGLGDCAFGAAAVRGLQGRGPGGVMFESHYEIFLFLGQEPVPASRSRTRSGVRSP